MNKQGSTYVKGCHMKRLVLQRLCPEPHTAISVLSEHFFDAYDMTLYRPLTSAQSSRPTTPCLPRLRAVRLGQRRLLQAVQIQSLKKED